MWKIFKRKEGKANAKLAKGIEEFHVSSFRFQVLENKTS
jgi:hypothetical protein